MVWGNGLTGVFFLHVSTCPNIICWKAYSLSIEWSWYPNWQSVNCRCMDALWTLSSMIYMSIFLLVPYCPDYFVVHFWSQEGRVLLLYSLSRLLQLFWILCNSLRISESACQFLQSNHLGYWQRSCWMCRSVPGSLCQLNNGKVFNPWSWDAFQFL